MLQLHLNDRQFYCLLRCILYYRFHGISFDFLPHESIINTAKNSPYIGCWHGGSVAHRTILMKNSWHKFYTPLQIMHGSGVWPMCYVWPDTEQLHLQVIWRYMVIGWILIWLIGIDQSYTIINGHDGPLCEPYSDVIMRVMVSQITGVSFVGSTIC